VTQHRFVDHPTAEGEDATLADGGVQHGAGPRERVGVGPVGGADRRDLRRMNAGGGLKPLAAASRASFASPFSSPMSR
jgi:hypothetical protein